METFKTFKIDELQVRFVWDEHYRTRGSYAMDTPEETKRFEDAEIAAIEAGDLAAFGCIVEKQCPCCGHWEHKDSLWGIVMDPNSSDEDFKAFVLENMETN